MSIEIKQLIEYIIQPSLKQMKAYGLADEQLIVGTCAKESDLGHFLHQINGGPALGIYQIEPATYDSIVNDYLAYKHDLRNLILRACGYSVMPPADFLIKDLFFSTMICRCKYLWVKESLPKFGDINGQAKYWAKYYNANPVTGIPAKYIESYEKYVGGYYAK